MSALVVVGVSSPSVNLFATVLRSYHHNRELKCNLQLTDEDKAHAEKKAQEAITEAQSIIEANPQVLSTKTYIQHLIVNITLRDDVENRFELETGVALLSSNLLFRNHLEVLPVHYCAVMGYTLDMMKLFLRYSLVSVLDKTRGQFRFTPLHFTSSHHQKCIIKAILQVCPQAVQISDERNVLPIHQVATNTTNLDILSLFINAHPQSLSCQTLTGATPLHLAARFSRCIKIIKRIHDGHPDAAKILDKNNRLPIHYIVHENDHLTMSHKISYMKRSGYYGLFHNFKVRARNHTRPSWKKPTPWTNILTKIMLDDNQEIEQEPNMTVKQQAWCKAVFHLFHSKPVGKAYPLIIHHGMGKMPKRDISKLISFPSFRINTELVDEDGNTSLMIAIHQASQPCNHKYWNEYYQPIIEKLFRRLCKSSNKAEYHKSLPATKAIDGNGRHLLHIAAEGGLPWFALQDIVEGNIDAIRICDYRDCSGLLPFMLASEGDKRDLSCAYELLRRRPDLLDVLGLSQYIPLESQGRSKRRRRQY